jgi:polyhydroxybutyrate depolymerase
MTNRLGCELNNRIAAIASVSGTIGNEITCSPTRVVPSCHFHGTADQVVSYTGDMFGLDAEALVAYWRRHDGCDSTPSTIDTLPHVANDSLHVIHYVYPNGAYGSDVEFYKVINGQHQWLGPTGEDINYAQAIWTFFSRYKWDPQYATGIAEVKSTTVSIYPNPATNQINIQLESSSGKRIVITMYDMTGRVVYTETGSGNLSINTANVSRGMYTVDVIADGQRLTKKVCLTD